MRCLQGYLWGVPATLPVGLRVRAAVLRYAHAMEVLRSVVVLLHIVGFAITFGAWVAEAAAGRFRTTRVMDYGLLASLLTGLALAAPWPAGVDLNYPKIGVKLVILVVIGGLLVGNHGTRFGMTATARAGGRDGPRCAQGEETCVRRGRGRCAA